MREGVGEFARAGEQDLLHAGAHPGPRFVFRARGESRLATGASPTHRGARTPGHQFHFPANCMNAGTRTKRISVASRSTATASPKPRICTARVRAKAKLPNTRIMISAADVIVD